MAAGRAWPGRAGHSQALPGRGRAAIWKFYKLLILYKDHSMKIRIECLHEIGFKIDYLNSYPIEILNLITILHKIILII